jgi:uncharacterized OsmC-like protein
MSANPITASASYLHREHVLVEMPNGTLIADHPVFLGGDGRGPSAGELVLMALSAGSVLAVSEEAQRRGVSVGAVARATFQTVRERIDGPMATLACMASLRHRLELTFSGAYEDTRALTDAAAANPVARAMARGIPLDERVEFIRTTNERVVGDFLNETMHEQESAWSDQPLGRPSISPPEDRWRVGASLLERDAALLLHASQTYVAGLSTEHRRVGPSPNELLVASLACCTVFYIAHNTRFRSIPVDKISAAATAQVDESGAIASMVKTASVTGNLTDQEMAEIEFMANNCYVGVTMKRGVEVGFEVDVQSNPAPAARVPGAAFDGSICDDGACCIPDLSA